MMRRAHATPAFGERRRGSPRLHHRAVLRPCFRLRHHPDHPADGRPPEPAGVGQGMAMLAILWWCWCSFAWLGNTIHVDHGIARLAMFGAMAVMFLVSLTIPEAFVDHPGGLF